MNRMRVRLHARWIGLPSEVAVCGDRRHELISSGWKLCPHLGVGLRAARASMAVMASIGSFRTACVHDGAISIAFPVPRLVGARVVAQIHHVLTDLTKADAVRENASNDQRAELEKLPGGTCDRMRDPLPTRRESSAAQCCIV